MAYQSKFTGATVDELLTVVQNWKSDPDSMMEDIDKSAFWDKITEADILGKLTEKGILGILTEGGILGKLTEKGILGKLTEKGILGKLTEEGILGILSGDGIVGKFSDSNYSTIESKVWPKVSGQDVVDKINTVANNIVFTKFVDAQAGAGDTTD